MSGNVELLADGVDYTEHNPLPCQLAGKTAPCTLRAASKGGMVSDDGRTVATTTHTDQGWYEYVADPPAS